MSTLFVNNLNTASGSTITVPTGKKLIVTDEGALTAPGMILQTVRSEYRTYVTTTSTSFVASGHASKALAYTRKLKRSGPGVCAVRQHRNGLPTVRAL